MEIKDTSICVRIEINGEHQEITDFMAWCRQHEIHSIPGAGVFGQGRLVAYYPVIDAERIVEFWGDGEDNCPHINRTFTGPMLYTDPLTQAWCCPDCGDRGFEQVGDGIKTLEPSEAMLKRAGMYKKDHIEEVIKDMGECHWLSRAIRSDVTIVTDDQRFSLPNIEMAPKEIIESIDILKATYRGKS